MLVFLISNKVLIIITTKAIKHYNFNLADVEATLQQR